MKPETLNPENLLTEAPDKAPYFIPFRSQEPFVRVGRELFRLGDVLRMRQEGLRRELDVPGSVAATVAEGGFPNLKTALSTVPTEYLFLVDEQAAGSHQAEVFKFLVNLFKQREVLCEVFFYKTEMHRFWNDQHPDGISAEQLQRQFGFHRLIVLGDGHGLLDPGAGLRNAPGAGNAPQFLKPTAVDFLKHWKRRLLLTLVPLASWTFREGALHDLFAIFPAGTSGLVEATKFLERTLDEEDRPTFANWCERLVSDEVSTENGSEPDINYRTWRTAADHRDYLENRSVSTQSADRSSPTSSPTRSSSWARAQSGASRSAATTATRPWSATSRTPASGSIPTTTRGSSSSSVASRPSRPQATGSGWPTSARSCAHT
ncbi:MAG: hypothetical protein AAB316_19655, partial [Bacteroidota bacterium]